MRIAIIGGGPGGYTAAFEAARLGHEVTLVEKKALGGVCLNCGCIPTKTLRSSADLLHKAQHMDMWGLEGCDGATVNLAALRQRKEKIISALGEGLLKTCANLKVNFLTGVGSIKDAHTVLVKTDSGATEIKCDRMLIATGSSALELPGLKFDHQHICSSDDALDLKSIPASLIIVGGGVIGCELACIYHDFGSHVTIVEGQDSILPLPSVDLDVRNLLARELRKRKIAVITGHTLQNVRVEGNVAKAEAAASPFSSKVKPDAQPTPVEAEMILVTVGRTPNTAELGLAQADVKVDKRGWIEVDEYLQTSVPGIYAAGDVLGAGHIMLAHVAAAEGMNFIANLDGPRKAMNYAVVPSAIFTDPEVGTVGLTEEQAKEKGLEYVTGLTQMRELGKAQAMSELPGFFKVLAEKASGKIIGAHIAGAHASDLIAEAALAMANNLTLENIASTIHAHPTLAEGFCEASLCAWHKM